MSHNYSYTSKGGTEPELFTVLDEKVCAHLGIECHPTKWAYDWDNVISLLVAQGKTLPEVRALLVEWRVKDEFNNDRDQEGFDALIKICEFLDANYEARAWRTMGFARR